MKEFSDDTPTQVPYWMRKQWKNGNSVEESGKWVKEKTERKGER